MAETNHTSMDDIFMDCLRGTTSPEEVIRRHGPYLDPSQGADSGPYVVFGERPGQPSAAYALGAVAALSVLAVESPRHAEALDSLSGRGVVGVTLQSNALQNALWQGRHRKATVTVAANLADPDAYPVLQESMFSATALKGDHIFYKTPLVAVNDSSAALEGKFGVTDVFALLRAYNWLLLNVRESPAWVAGYRQAANRAKKEFPREVKLSPTGQKRLEENPPHLEPAKARFTSLDLPRRQPSGSRARPGSRQAADARDPRLGHAPESGPLPAETTEAAWQDLVEAAKQRYGACVARRKQAKQALQAIYQQHPALTLSQKKEIQDGEHDYRALLESPEEIAAALAAYERPLEGGYDDRAAIAFAAAQALGLPAGQYNEARSAALNYLRTYLDQIRYDSPKDLGNLTDDYAVTADDLGQYAPVVTATEEIPTPAQLVQLAAQVVTANKESALPLGTMPPVKSKNPLRDTATAHQTWLYNAGVVSDVAAALQLHLSRRYGCTVPLAPGFGHRVNGDTPADAVFKVLAICAQLDGGAQMPANTPQLKRLLAQVDPAALGTAQETFQKLQSRCMTAPVVETPTVANRATAAAGTVATRAAQVARRFHR